MNKKTHTQKNHKVCKTKELFEIKKNCLFFDQKQKKKVYDDIFKPTFNIFVNKLKIKFFLLIDHVVILTATSIEN